MMKNVSFMLFILYTDNSNWKDFAAKALNQCVTVKLIFMETITNLCCE